MRTFLNLPIALVVALSIPTALSTEQKPISSHFHKTIANVLYDDPNYLSLVKLLTRARLIPTLNKLTNATFFAPTNDAIEKSKLWSAYLEDDAPLRDNIQEELRQQLFYHLLNYSVSALPQDDALEKYQTLHFPKPYVEPPTGDPPPMPPWIPVPGGTLGGQSQRLRAWTHEGKSRIGVDAFGKGGAEAGEGVNASNGYVYGLSDMLQPPPDLARVVSQIEDAAYFDKILTPEIKRVLNSSSEMTLFLPVDAAWQSLERYERLYLESEFATDDLKKILGMHAVIEDGVRYQDTFEEDTTLKTLDGTKLKVVVSDGKTTVSDAKLVQPDIYASNGVLHLVDSLLIPPGALQLTPEKYLLTMNCTTFVSLIHSVNLTHLINATDTSYTILAPTDDVLSVFGDHDLPEKGSDELKRLLQYHFLPGRWGKKKLDRTMLLETSLEEEGLGGNKQVMTVDVTPGDDKAGKDTHIHFGGASVIGDAIPANNSLIYLVSRPIVPPTDALQTALPRLDLSTFLAAIFSTTLAEKFKNTPRTSLIIPHNDAFKRLGELVSAHLLASSKSDLESVLLHHALDTVQYAQSMVNGSQHTFATLEGSDIQIERLDNGTVIVKPSGGWSGMRAALYTQDLLTQTGVVHEMSDILIPRSINITVGKLIKAGKASTMNTILTKAGFDWVLNGTAPPEDSEWAGKGLDGAGWTLLCPTDNAFKGINLTQLYADADGLKAIVAQHLIPSNAGADLHFIDENPMFNNRPVPFEDSPTYTTLQSRSSAYGDIVFKRQEQAGIETFVVGIKDARGTNGDGDWARVVSWGRSTTHGGGGVVQIDQLLVPYYPRWWVAYGAPIGVGVIGGLLICGFFYLVALVWRRDTTEATYEPVGGFGPDDES